MVGNPKCCLGWVNESLIINSQSNSIYMMQQHFFAFPTTDIIVCFQLCAKTSVMASKDFTEDRMWLNGK